MPLRRKKSQDKNTHQGEQHEHGPLLAYHPLPVDEPVGGDVSMALHAPGQVELVTVEPIPQASHHRLIGPT